MLSLLLLLTLGRSVWGAAYTCTDGCAINEYYVDDGYCDCTDCGDEADYDCDTCLNNCPTECGGYTLCPGIVQCPGVACIINSTSMDDGICDCDDCADESLWTCGSCPYCPQTCGQGVVCVGGSTTPGPLMTTDENTFYCDNGCDISVAYVDDDFCDCGECEDELEWTCGSCHGGCPDFCGGYTRCVSQNGTQEPQTTNPQTTEGANICDDGCEIDASYFSDGFCDCTQCEDEALYTCESCPGCPETCGAYMECTGEPATTEEPPTTEEPTTTPSVYYMCDDGCDIFASYVNDGWCDCSQCEEEPLQTCESCPGCPVTCDAYVVCTGEPLTTEEPATTDESQTTAATTEAPVTTEAPETTVAVQTTADAQTTAGAQTTEGTHTDAAASAHLLLPALMGLLYAFYSL